MVDSWWFWGLAVVSERDLRGCLVFVIVLIFMIQGVQVASSNPVTLQASVTEWTVPTPRSGPWGLALDQSGNCCWFVEYYASKIAHLDPSTGYFQEWEIPSRDSNPYSIAVTSVAGTVMVWGTEFASGRVFAFSPESGKFSEYSVPGGVEYISIEPGNGMNTRVWFTETTNNRNGEFIYDSTSGNVTFYQDSFPVAVGGGAYDVHANSGSIWFAGFSALVRWDRASSEYTIWPLPNHNSAVGRFITFDARGQAWYTQGVADPASNDNFVGVLRGNVIEEWRIPSAGSNPRGISINPLTQQPWIAEQSSLQGNGTVARLSDFSNGTLFPSSPITTPSTGTLRPIVLSPVRSPASASNSTVTSTTRSIDPTQEGPFAAYVLGPTLPSDAIGDSSGNVWMSEPGANKIARLTVSSPDYAVTVSSSNLSSTQRTSVYISVFVNSVSGYAGDVTLTAPNLPQGVTARFDPNPVHVSPGGNGTSNVVIEIANASLGTDLVIIHGSDVSGIARSISIILTITNSTGQSSSKSQCAMPTFMLDLTLLSGLLADVLIGGFYIGLPTGSVSRRLHSLRSLSRKSWLVICLVGPSALALASCLFLIVC